MITKIYVGSKEFIAYQYFDGKKIFVRKGEFNISIPHLWTSKADIINAGDNEKIVGKIIAKNVKETIEGLRL